MIIDKVAVIAVITMCFASSVVFPQNISETSKINRLKQELAISTGPVKGEVLNAISLELILMNSDSSIYYIKKAKAYNYKNEYYSKYLKSLEYECDYYNLIGDFNKVIELAKKGIRFSKSASMDEYIPKFYNYLPYAYSILEDYTGQSEASKKALEYSTKFNDTLQMIIAYGNLARFYWHIDDLEGAIRETTRSLDLAVVFSEFKKTSTLYGSLSVFYFSRGDYDQALSSNEKALDFASNLADSSLILQNKGTIYYLKDSFDLARKYFNTSFRFYKDSRNNLKIGDHFFYMGMMSLKEKKYKRAEITLDSAYYYAVKSSNIGVVKEIYYAKYEIAQYFNQPKKALEYLKEYYTLNDSIVKKNNTILLKETEWKAQLENEKREKKFLLIEEKILQKKILAESKAKTWSFIAFTISIFIIVSLVIIIRQRKKVVQTKKILKEFEYQKNIELKNKELLTLKMQRVNRGNLIEELNTKLDELKSNLESQNIESDQIVKDLSLISKNFGSDIEKDWEEFKIYFENLHESFFQKLRKKHPKLTNNDEKIIAYIKVNIDTKQIAKLLNVSPETVHTQRYRLRKKMNLPKNAVIRDYLDF